MNAEAEGDHHRHHHRHHQQQQQQQRKVANGRNDNGMGNIESWYLQHQRVPWREFLPC